MFNRHVVLIFGFGICGFGQIRGNDEDSTNKSFSFEVRKGMPRTHVALVWRDGFLQAFQLRAKPEGTILQTIKVGETEIVACDLDQQDLPPDWLGTLDYNKDGYRDIYVQVAAGSVRTYAVIIYDRKKKQFVASKALSSIPDLDTSAGIPAAKLQ